MSSTNAPTSTSAVSSDKDYWLDPSVARLYALACGVTQPFADVILENAQIAKHDGDIESFDLACGTGAMIGSLYNALPKEKWGKEKTKVFGGDINEGMVQYVKEKGKKEGWEGLEAGVVDAKDLSSFSPESYTHIFINFSIFLFPNPTETLASCIKLLKPNGFFGMTTWCTIPWYPYVEKAVTAIPNIPKDFPNKTEFEESYFSGLQWLKEDFVQGLLKDAGFADVQLKKVSRKVGCGTPAEFVQTMSIPLQILNERLGDGAEDLKVQICEKVREMFVEEFGVKGPVSLEWVSLVVTGWKR